MSVFFVEEGHVSGKDHNVDWHSLPQTQCFGSLLTRFGFGFSYYPCTLAWLGTNELFLLISFENCLKIT
jgi:hypothetical protein